uniref:Lens epithelium-derived growth factor integrase-binding domain-containing protein n=1 Tax=Anopheles farauti TaxID=69004 RepID=A0A182QSC9_9DIPT
MSFQEDIFDDGATIVIDEMEENADSGSGGVDQPRPEVATSSDHQAAGSSSTAQPKKGVQRTLKSYVVWEPMEVMFPKALLIKRIEPLVECKPQEEKEPEPKPQKEKEPEPKPQDEIDLLDDEKIKMLVIEAMMVDHNIAIKSTIKPSGAEPERCLQLLAKFGALPVTATMLKKNPDCVLSMEKMTNYVGAKNNGNITYREKVKFNYQAQQIRDKAARILVHFAQILGINEVPFTPSFQKLVENFQEKTKHLSKKKLYMLTDEADLDADTGTESKKANTANVDHNYAASSN